MNELQITEYKSIRVLTTQQIAEAYGSDTRVISNNFNRNKERYIEGKHYICLEDGEKREFVDHLKLMTVQRKHRSFIFGRKKELSFMRSHLTLTRHGKSTTDWLTTILRNKSSSNDNRPEDSVTCTG